MARSLVTDHRATNQVTMLIAITYPTVGIRERGRTLYTKGSRMRSTRTGGGSLIRAALSVK